MPSTKETSAPLMGGYVAPGYEHVKKAFRKNFVQGLDTGASFSVYHKGRCVVNLWGGYQNKTTKQPWEENTIAMVWSVTKAISAVCLAILNERGDLDYSRPVCHYWPEFGQCGKHNITVAQLISHQAGLPLIRGTKVTWSLARDHVRIGEVLAAQTPEWKPGSRHGYHSFTMGWYMDQLIRRCDPKHRSMAKFFRDEIAGPFELDFRVGTPLEEEHRVAHMTDAKLQGIKHMLFHNPEEFWHLLCQYLNPTALLRQIDAVPGELNGVATANLAAYHQLELPQCNGIGTASSVAKLFGILANKGVDPVSEQRLLSEKSCDKLGKPITHGMDQMYKLEGLFQMFSYGMEVTNAEGHQIFGHPGYGGQAAYADPEHRLGWCYVTSRLAAYGSPMQDPRYRRLRNAMYQAVRDAQMECLSLADDFE